MYYWHQHPIQIHFWKHLWYLSHILSHLRGIQDLLNMMAEICFHFALTLKKGICVTHN